MPGSRPPARLTLIASLEALSDDEAQVIRPDGFSTKGGGCTSQERAISRTGMCSDSANQKPERVGVTENQRQLYVSEPCQISKTGNGELWASYNLRAEGSSHLCVPKISSLRLNNQITIPAELTITVSDFFTHSRAITVGLSRSPAVPHV